MSENKNTPTDTESECTPVQTKKKALRKHLSKSTEKRSKKVSKKTEKGAKKPAEKPKKQESNPSTPQPSQNKQIIGRLQVNPTIFNKSRLSLPSQNNTPTQSQCRIYFRPTSTTSTVVTHHDLNSRRLSDVNNFMNIVDSLNTYIESYDESSEIYEITSVEWTEQSCEYSEFSEDQFLTE